MSFLNYKIKLLPTSVWYQFYILPTIKITYNNRLFGYCNIEFWWGKWGIEVAFLNED